MHFKFYSLYNIILTRKKYGNINNARTTIVNKENISPFSNFYIKFYSFRMYIQIALLAAYI